MYDVIIAGASFAGLAAATAVKGCETLVLDRLPIGAGQTSACALPESWVNRLGAVDSILQRHNFVHLHVGRNDHIGDISAEPYVTVDYARFCQAVAAQCDFAFRKERVVGVLGSSVVTSSQAYRGKELIDCTGWRRALSGYLPGEDKRRAVNFGLEVEVEITGEDLHFYYDDTLPTGMGWFFPAGKVARIGVSDYNGQVRLQPALAKLLARLAPGREITAVHAGFFPHGLTDPIEYNIWRAGDSGGHCYGYSGEGIRPALYFGAIAGHLVREILIGNLHRADAQERYRRVVEASSPSFFWMNFAQSLHLALPAWGKSLIWRGLAGSGAVNRLFRQYECQTAKIEQELATIAAKVDSQKTGISSLTRGI